MSLSAKRRGIFNSGPFQILFFTGSHLRKEPPAQLAIQLPLQFPVPAGQKNSYAEIYDRIWPDREKRR